LKAASGFAIGAGVVSAAGCATPAGAAAVESAMGKNPLPRWRGANLLEKFSRGQTGASPNRPFVERDFQWLKQWGFDFVRLPLDYRFWVELPDRRKFDEASLKEIDQAVDWGKQYGIHVCINFHRAPGYCVNAPEWEPFNLWTDAEAQEICELHWRTFAKRYKEAPATRLSFNLWNEPHQVGNRGLTRESHEKVVRRMVAAIRAESPDRLIIADGLSWGRDTMPELADLKIAQSTRAYTPHYLTHYKASWSGGAQHTVPPTWPYKEGQTLWDREKLREFWRPWRDLSQKGIGVHCGEGGVYQYTPHEVALGFLRDALGVLKEYNIGWALWNMRGSFGWIDSNRPDVQYEPFEGHKLDRKMLELLREM
jgi:endoglucanase